MIESEVQKIIRLEASRRGWRLWRNNVGMAFDQRNNPVRFGLANESAQVNARLKSSDLIGIVPTIVTPQHIGHTLGVFTSIECKRSNWKWVGTKREEAQLAWIHLVQQLGGYGKFVRGVEDL